MEVHLFHLRILTEKMHPQRKLQRFWKVSIQTFEWLVHFYTRFLNVRDTRIYWNFGGPFVSFKDTRKEKAPSNKTPTLLKSMNTDIWMVGTFLYAVLKLKRNFWKNKVVTGKNAFFLIGPFCTPHSISVNVGFLQRMKMLIVVLSSKKRSSSFLKSVCVFQKILFQS